MEISNSNATFISTEAYLSPTVTESVDENKVAVYPIFTAAIARPLIRGGWRLMDIGPNANDRSRTVFYFADSIPFRNELGRITKARKSKKNAKQED